MENNRRDQVINRAFLTTAWTFQLVAAGPIFVWLGLVAISNLFYTFDPVVDFITHLFTSVFAAGIFFIVLVQRKLRKEDALNMSLTLRFEVAKLALATALWVWLMMDALFGPADHYGYYHGRKTRIIASAVSVLLIFILFLPTVLFVIRDKKLSSLDDQQVEREEAGVTTPLLQDPHSETA